MKNKKPLWISLIVLDVAVTAFLFVISIIMLVNAPKTQTERAEMTGLIGYLANHPTVYLVAFVIPLFVLLAANIIGLVWYVKKTSKREPAKISDLTEEQKEALRQELLKDLAAPKVEPKEEPKAEEPKEEKKD